MLFSALRIQNNALNQHYVIFSSFPCCSVHWCYCSVLFCFPTDPYYLTYNTVWSSWKKESPNVTCELVKMKKGEITKIVCCTLVLLNIWRNIKTKYTKTSIAFLWVICVYFCNPCSRSNSYSKRLSWNVSDVIHFPMMSVQPCDDARGEKTDTHVQ